MPRAPPARHPKRNPFPSLPPAYLVGQGLFPHAHVQARLQRQPLRLLPPVSKQGRVDLRGHQGGNMHVLLCGMDPMSWTRVRFEGPCCPFGIPRPVLGAMPPSSSLLPSLCSSLSSLSLSLLPHLHDAHVPVHRHGLPHMEGQDVVGGSWDQAAQTALVKRGPKWVEIMSQVIDTA